MSEWFSISTAPKDGTKVDLWVVYEKFMARPPNRIIDCWYDGLWVTKDSYNYTVSVKDSKSCKITHWMPLPAPPKKNPA